MIRQYSAFLVNGVLITILAWGIQYTLYRISGYDSSLAYSVATIVATAITMLINFFVQKNFIFKNEGMFHRYIIADLVNMALVGVLAPLFRLVILNMAGVEWGDKGGFIVAAFIASIPVFFIKRNWVFSVRSELGKAG
jgi:putative flippase GtrA